MIRRRSRDSDTSAELTSRGIGVGASGLVITLLGVGLASPILVWVGVSMVSSLAVALAWLALSVRMFRRRFPHARRSVVPIPLSVGGNGSVVISIKTATQRRGLRLSNALASSLDVREQAAAELTGGRSTKATVWRSPQELRLEYRLNPTHRGRWPLGPARVSIADVLGMATADVAADVVEHVPVWPRITDLSAATGALMGNSERVILGARTPFPDDSSLRDYRDGDDLRRVHWKSTARRGAMVVRADERAGVRPATVIVDLSPHPIAAEWSIAAAASIAVSILESGHPVQLIGATIDLAQDPTDSDQRRDMARAALLNRTLDLEAPMSREAGQRHTQTAADIATHEGALGDVVIGVFEPLGDDVLSTLVPLGDTGRAWALVRTDANPRHRETADATVRALLRAGWHATTATADVPLADAWSGLVSGGPR